MLQKLHIRNYAIIDELNINFSGQLNIITGETGAGKSILIGALNLILGQRADSSVLQDKGKKCIVEGYFFIKNNEAVKIFLAANDLEADDEILLRREISASSKSRSFINDTLVNLAQLKELAVLLVDLHQQFDSIELSRENFQREVLDALANNGETLQQFKRTFAEYTTVKKQLNSLQLQQVNSNKELDYNQFLFDELEELSLQENELETLEAEIKLLNNAESIKQQINGIYFELKDGDLPIVQQLKVLQNNLKTLIQYHPGLATLHQRITSALLEIQDVADELEHLDRGILYDPERIQIVNERLSAGYKLFKKHSVNTTRQLLILQDQLQQKLDAVVNISTSIEKLELYAVKMSNQCFSISNIISANREKQVKPFTQNVNKLLAQVGMPNAQLKVQIKPEGLTEYGTDEINFLFDANNSNRFEPLHKVASGGELSRLMLSVKSLVAQQLELPTLIFDEIDTGISGEAAKQVGIIMKNLSEAHQVIAITHQPQIAAKATAHYFVYKEIINDKIVTSIRLLNNDERITVIAQMLSGEKPTAAALENAREMMN